MSAVLRVLCVRVGPDAERGINVMCVVAHRASRVDVKKLEKQEAKIKVWAVVLGL